MSKGKLTLDESLSVKSAAVRRVIEIDDALAELNVSAEFKPLCDFDLQYKAALEDEKKALQSAIKKLFYFAIVELS